MIIVPSKTMSRIITATGYVLSNYFDPTISKLWKRVT